MVYTTKQKRSSFSQKQQGSGCPCRIQSRKDQIQNPALGQQAMNEFWYKQESFMQLRKHLLSVRTALVIVMGSCMTATIAQTPATNALTIFMHRQDSLFSKAYEQRDLTRYHQVLDTFLATYKALPEAEQKKHARSHINAYYNLSCTYALLNKKGPALDYLDKAIQAGYYNYSHIQEDKDLDPLRKEKRFSQLIEPLRKTGDYLYILQRAEQYNPSDTSAVPAFTYQTANKPELVALRKAFNLDSIAGKGNDVSRILNLLHWIHNLVPHDGNHENPTVKNAVSMIAICKKDNRGLNCRGLATVLNECYLSLGFKARYVTCLPKDSLRVDPDCHVINMVYAPSLKKWIWVDPTHDAYVMNEKGELLGLEEVRERLIHKRPLLLNPEANWNHQQSTTKEYYLYNYMAKNLYMLESPVNSEYDTETVSPGKTFTYVRLVPLDYFKQSPRKSVRHSQQQQTDYVFYTTNNPAAFWQAPQ
jgi:transglutaminase-like putative cysteine protease